MASMEDRDSERQKGQCATNIGSCEVHLVTDDPDEIDDAKLSDSKPNSSIRSEPIVGHEAQELCRFGSEQIDDDVKQNTDGTIPTDKCSANNIMPSDRKPEGNSCVYPTCSESYLSTGCCQPEPHINRESLNIATSPSDRNSLAIALPDELPSDDDGHCRSPCQAAGARCDKKRESSRRRVRQTVNSKVNISESDTHSFPFNNIRDLSQKSVSLNAHSILKRMCHAVRGNDLAVLDCLLKRRVLDINTGLHHPSVDDCDYSQRCSLLHLVAKVGNHEMLAVVLNHEPDVNRVTSGGETALHIACKRGHVTCVRQLIDYGADVNLRNEISEEDTPLMVTVASYKHYLPQAVHYTEIIKLLLRANCDVNLPDSAGFTPLHLAVTKEGTKLTKMLLSAGADLNSCSHGVRTPLMRAVEHDCLNNARLLLDAGCDVNFSMNKSQSALSLAVQANNVAAVLDLLGSGADPNLLFPDMCVLYFVARHKLLLILLLLLLYDGDVNAQNPFDGASLVLTVTRRESLVGTRMLLGYGADVNLANKLGTTPLWASVKCHNVNMIRLLLEANPDLEATSMELHILWPITALRLALELGHADAAEVLLIAGSTVKKLWLKEQNMPRKLVQNPAFLSLVQSWLSNPRSLKQVCRIVIRKAIGLNPLVKLKTLNYPERLRDYILTRDL